MKHAGDDSSTFSKALVSRPELLEDLVDEVQEYLEQHFEDADFVFRVVLLTSEAATNAMKHGNQFDPAKLVRVDVAASTGGVRIRVCDQGAGFDPGAQSDPLQEENLMRTGGRGLFLIREMADEVSFEDDGR